MDLYEKDIISTVLPFDASGGRLGEAANVMVIHVERASWAVNEPFRGQIDGQNRTDHAQGRIDLGSAEQHRFERLRLVEPWRTARHQDYAVIVQAADVRLDFQLTRHPSETKSLSLLTLPFR